MPRAFKPVPARHPVWHVIRNVAGVLLMLLGVIGLFVPILQGVLFLVVGLSLVELTIKHRAHHWLSARWRWYRWVAHAHHRAKRKLLRRGRPKPPRDA